ncbi:MAG TPA: trypsin-like peptidase domain-containing protein [Pseudonocardiaceae bacterium]|jgi:putative serine protease PepD|nr:trypsin-like peptidase domain-containing protein [Pseudonocardiaceae bacterium]
MTENTPGAAGNVPEHQQPAEGAATPGEGSSWSSQVPGAEHSPTSPAQQSQPQPSAPGQQGEAQQPSPWSAAGYQTYRPAEAPTAQAPSEAPGGYPTIQAAQLPGSAPAEGPTSGYQAGQSAGGYQNADAGSYSQQQASEHTGGYPSLGGTETSANYPNTGSPETPGGYPSSGVNFGSYPPLGGQQTATMPASASPRRSRGALVAGVAVLALVVGGAAGSLGGYLFSGSSNSTVQSALNEPVPTATQASAPAGSVQAVANKVLPTVVEISVQVQSDQGISGDTGSGIILTSDGKILTNNHVVADAATGGQIQVIFSSGKTVNATIIGRDPTSDIAVIQAQGVSGLPIASLGNSNNLQVGQDVVAIGAPYGLSGTVTSGIVSSLHRPTVAGDSSENGQSSQETVMDAIQTDAPINPGNSGGALVNMQGQVIGINSAIYSSSSSDGSQGGNVGIGFAIPVDQARRLANDIISTGHSTQTVLGVSVTDNVEGIPASQQGQLDPDQQSEEEQAGLTNGAYIAQVTSGGPADKAGLKQGVVVTKADGRLITSANGLVAAVHAAAPGDQMTLTLSNNSTVTVTLSGETVQTN